MVSWIKNPVVLLFVYSLLHNDGCMRILIFFTISNPHTIGVQSILVTVNISTDVVKKKQKIQHRI